MNTDQAGISGAELRRIVARASSLFERLDPQVFSPSPDADEQLVRSRLDGWCQAVAKGDSEQFQRCLAWDGLSPEMARRAMTPVSLRHDAPLPGWATTLSEVVHLASSTVPPAPDGQSAPLHRFLDRQKPLPFEELLTPFVLFAQRDLQSRAGACYQRLTDQAHAALERALLGQLIDTAAQPLLLTFAVWKAGHQSSFARLLARVQEPHGRSLYLGFIQEMLAGKQIPFFMDYAALARLLATMTNLWVEAQHEFLQRLNADWPIIEQTFGGGATLGQVTGIQPLLSDPHRGRRSVMALQIEPGVSVVYKPKNLGTEQAYNQLLAWLNEQGCPLPLKALQVMDHGSHGWVECVEPQPCDDTDALARHYQRAGMLLCLAYVLEAVDCHYENLIAHGEHPILIDTETLMHHRPAIESLGSVQTAQNRAFFQMNNSVMRTALLALWHVDSNLGSAFDFSGLGSHVQEERLYKGLQWSFVNTDHMALDLKDLRIPAPSHHVPTVQGEPARLADWVATVAEGFAQMYRLLLEKRDALLAEDSPLWTMAGQPIRALFRPTDTYTRLLWQLREPEYLRDGVERSFGLELLKRAAAGASERPAFWPIVQTERQQMEQLDVPYFALSSDDDVLELSPGNRLTDFFQGSGFHAVLERIKTLSEADLAMQVQLIQGSLYLRTVPGQESAAVGQPGARATVEVVEVGVDREVMPDDAALRAEALAIASRLRERAICAPDGTVTWLAPQLIFQQERFQLQPIGTSLYDGSLGIALFLAALERVKGDGEFRDLCLGALHEYRQALPGSERARARRSSDLTLGLSGDLGGTIYALTCIGTFLGDDSLVADALDVARLLTPEVIAGDSQLDIIGGTAGALLSVLALYRVVQDPSVLESAVACGRHLLAQSVSTSNGRAWKTLNGRLLTGFSHGAAGIAYALLKLAEVTDRAEFKTAAAEAIAYEQSVFLPDVGNWPDLRDFSRYLKSNGRSDPRPLMSSWCHGATGIGLGRLGGLSILQSAAIQQDIQVALQTTRNHLAHRQGMVDQLCCGNMGRIELLLCAAQRLGQPELLTEARVYASQIVQEAGQRGYALEPALHPSVYVPGFFRGETGVGYTLLRLTDAEKLPAILLGE
jgi:type 2 lantibiotic biosynthesis protein LanM